METEYRSHPDIIIFLIVLLVVDVVLVIVVVVVVLLVKWLWYSQPFTTPPLPLSSWYILNHGSPHIKPPRDSSSKRSKTRLWRYFRKLPPSYKDYSLPAASVSHCIALYRTVTRRFVRFVPLLSALNWSLSQDSRWQFISLRTALRFFVCRACYPSLSNSLYEFHSSFTPLIRHILPLLPVMLGLGRPWFLFNLGPCFVGVYRRKREKNVLKLTVWNTHG